LCSEGVDDEARRREPEVLSSSFSSLPCTNYKNMTKNVGRTVVVVMGWCGRKNDKRLVKKLRGPPPALAQWPRNFRENSRAGDSRDAI
jgi:hypothetical protein